MEVYGVQRKTIILVSKFLSQIQILFASPTLLLVHRSVVLKIFLLIFLFTYFYWESLEKIWESFN